MNTQTLLEEPELLSEVPPILKRLAKVIAYGFYEAEHISIISLLTAHSCIDEDSILDRLKFDKRQLSQALARLKNDKLVKQRVHKERQADTGNLKVINFYFINYKVFVNVVKYKLDHVRKKLQNEEQQAKNRPSFACVQCESKYSDLDVDSLIDFNTGLLKCTFCGASVEEDETHIQQISNRSSLALFNEQTEPVYKLLKACENIKIAPEVLEPEPTSLQIHSAGSKSNPHSSSSRSGWSNDRGRPDLYDQTINVNVGDEIPKPGKEKKAKAQPVWISQSTVFQEDSNDSSVDQNVTKDENNSQKTADIADNSHDILADLLAHEVVSKKPRLNMATEGGSDSSEDSEPDSVTFAEVKTATADNAPVMQTTELDSEEEREPLVQIGNEKFPLSKISDEMIQKMTHEEHEAYSKLVTEAMDIFF